MHARQPLLGDARASADERSDVKHARTKLLLTLALIGAVCMSAVGSASAMVLDPSFGRSGMTTLPALKGQSGTAPQQAIARPGGGYLVAGSGTRDSYWEDDWLVTAFDADGKLNRSFGKKGRVTLPSNFGSRFLSHSSAESIAVAPDGKVLVGSTVDVATDSDFDAYTREYGDPECNCTASRAAFAVIRLTRSGRIDRSFGNRGVTLIRSVVRTWDEGLNAELAGVAADDSGRAVVFGYSTDVKGKGGWAGKPYGLIYRLSTRGNLDRSFGSRGRVVENHAGATTGSTGLAVAVSAHGAIRTVAELSVKTGKERVGQRWVVRKYSSRGVLDSSFGVGGDRRIAVGRASLSEAAFAPDGSVTLGGSLLGEPTESSSDPPVALQSILERVTSTGAMDASFGSAGAVTLPPPPGSGEVWLQGMSLRSDGGVDLTERHRAGAPPEEYNGAEFNTGLRSYSGTGAPLSDAAGQIITPIPKLGNDYAFYVSEIFRQADRVTLVGERFSDLVRHENRITLMGLKP